MGSNSEERHGDDSMRQIYGNSPDNNKYTENHSVKKKERNIENIPIPVKEGMTKKGYVAIGVMLIVEAIFLLSGFKVMDFIGGTILAGLSFVLAWKVNYKYTQQSNYLFHYFTVTLNGVLKHYRTTSILYDASEKIFIYSIGIMAVQHFLLSWLSLTSILYSIGYYGMFLGIILNLAKRKTQFLYKGLFLYSLLLLLMTIQNAFGGYHYVNYHTVISILLFWYLAGLFQSLKISEIQINNTDEDEDIQLDIHSQDKDNLI